MTAEQEQKLAALKGAYLPNLARVRQAGSKEERDRAIAEHVNSYIAEIGNDRELADEFLTWLKDHVGWVMVNEGMGRHTVLSQQYISNATPTGAALVPDGATFRVWAPSALSVYLNGVFGSRAYDQQTEDRLLRKNPRGYWTGFQKGAQDGDQYRFWVLGVGSSGYKRDPYARELGPKEAFPNCFSILRRSDSYRWHDAAFRTPDFSDMVIYQAHIGTFAISTAGVASNFLDVAAKIPHLAALGINVLQPLPMDEQEVTPSMGYGGADLFAPDFPYVANRAELPDYLNSINGLLDAKNQASLKLEHISSGPNQLKALVDLCHVYGIAVVFDVVYNHAGGFTVNGHLDDNCLYYFDRLPNVNNNNDSLYFTDQDRGTGGLASLLSVGQQTGWQFCRELTTQLRELRPRLLQNAEFWPGRFSDIPSSVAPILTPASQGGAGFDVVQHDALRTALRNAVGAASVGAQASVSMTSIADVLYPPGLTSGWRAVTCIENHDLVLVGRDPRIPKLADGSNSRSWYARSRTRVANALLLTAPGIPQLFMGQEFLEDKPWDTDPSGPNLLEWDRLMGDSDAIDHLRFTQDLIRLRANQPALRGDNLNPFYCSDHDRVLAFHRWLEGIGHDVIVVASFAESTWWSYDLGLPILGFWKEVFNSDVYDHWVNPQVAGNGTGVQASSRPMHGFNASASIVIPANGLVVLAKA